MNIKKILSFILPVFLFGCGDSNNVKIVKEQVSPFDNTITVGNSLDNRTVCNNISWGSFKDDKNRDVVKYSCDMKNKSLIKYINDRILKIKNKTNDSVSKIRSDLISMQINNRVKIDDLHDLKKEIVGIMDSDDYLTYQEVATNLEKKMSMYNNQRFEKFQNDNTLRDKLKNDLNFKEKRDLDIYVNELNPMVNLIEHKKIKLSAGFYVMDHPGYDLFISNLFPDESNDGNEINNTVNFLNEKLDRMNSYLGENSKIKELSCNDRYQDNKVNNDRTLWQTYGINICKAESLSEITTIIDENISILNDVMEDNKKKLDEIDNLTKLLNENIDNFERKISNIVLEQVVLYSMVNEKPIIMSCYFKLKNSDTIIEYNKCLQLAYLSDDNGNELIHFDNYYFNNYIENELIYEINNSSFNSGFGKIF